MNSMANLKQKLKTNSNSLCIFLLICSLLLCAWQAVNLLTCENIAARHEEQETIHARKEHLTEFTARAADIEKEWSDHQETLNNFSSMVPAASEVPFALADLEKLLESHPVTLHAFRADEITWAEDHGMVNITVNVSGSATFLHRLLKTLEEEFVYLLQVKKFTWSTGEAQDFTMELELCLIVAGPPTAALPEELPEEAFYA